MIFGGVVVFLLSSYIIFGGGSKLGGKSVRSGRSFVQPKLVQMPELSKRHNDKCVIDNHSYDVKTNNCGAICKNEGNTLPRPFMYKSCLEFCNAGEFGV